MRTIAPGVIRALLAITALGISTAGFAHSGGGSSSSSSSSRPVADAPPTGGGGEGFGASPKAVAAWEAAGGRKGTGMSFQDWYKKVQIDFETRQGQLTWEATKAGWQASAWSIPYWSAEFANAAGKISQFGLNFVPVGKAVKVAVEIGKIGLDGVRGAAEGYASAKDKGMSDAEAEEVAAKTGAAAGILSSFTSMFGFAKDTGKAIAQTRAATTAAQIARTNRNLKTAILTTTTEEAISEVVGNAHTNSVVTNSSPMAQVAKD